MPVMTEAEDLESLTDLHLLCIIMQSIRKCCSIDDFRCAELVDAVLLNDNSIFEYILQEEVFFGVVSILECESAPICLTRPSLIARLQTTPNSRP